MRARARLAALLALAALAAAVSVVVVQAASSGLSNAATPLGIGKQLFRGHCGECHSLSYYGGCAGVGSNVVAGPKFWDLKITRAAAITAMEDGTPGHATAVKNLSWSNLTGIALFLMADTKLNATAKPGSPPCI